MTYQAIVIGRPDEIRLAASHLLLACSIGSPAHLHHFEVTREHTRLYCSRQAVNCLRSLPALRNLTIAPNVRE